MTRPVQLLVDTDETLLLAVHRKAARQGVTASEVVNAVLRQALAPEIAEVGGAPPLAAVIQGMMRAARKPPSTFPTKEVRASPGRGEPGACPAP